MYRHLENGYVPLCLAVVCLSVSLKDCQYDCLSVSTKTPIILHSDVLAENIYVPLYLSLEVCLSVCRKDCQYISLSVSNKTPIIFHSDVSAFIK